jgi:hypothetical protein
MIQNLRNYLLADNDNKSSFFFVAALVLVGPSVFYFFDRNKRSPNICAEINGVYLDKRILQIKYQENMQKAKMFFYYFGKSMKESEIFGMLFDGMSPEMFTFSNEIKNCFLSGMFSGHYGISQQVYSTILSNYFEKDKYKFIDPFVGMISLEILKGNKDIENMVKQIGLPFDVIEANAEVSVGAALSESVLLTNFYLIHSMIKDQVSKKSDIVIDSIDFDIYDFSDNQLLSNFEKIVPSENDLKMFYNSKINCGSLIYNSPELFDIEYCLFSLKKGFGKTREDIQREIGVIMSVNKKYEDIVSRLNIFLNNELMKSNYCTLEKDKKDEKIKILTGNVSIDFANNIFSACDCTEGSIFNFFIDECLYIGRIKKFTKSVVLPFEKVKEKIEKDFVNNVLREKIESNIKNFQLKRDVFRDKDLYLKKSYRYCHQKKLENEKEEKNKQSYDKLIKNKVAVGMGKENDSFFLKDSDGIKFFVVRKVNSIEDKKVKSDQKNNHVGLNKEVKIFFDKAIKFEIEKGNYLKSLGSQDTTDEVDSFF